MTAISMKALPASEAEADPSIGDRDSFARYLTYFGERSMRKCPDYEIVYRRLKPTGPALCPSTFDQTRGSLQFFLFEIDDIGASLSIHSRESQKSERLEWHQWLSGEMVILRCKARTLRGYIRSDGSSRL